MNVRVKTCMPRLTIYLPTANEYWPGTIHYIFYVLYKLYVYIYNMPVKENQEIDRSMELTSPDSTCCE